MYKLEVDPRRDDVVLMNEGSMVQFLFSGYGQTEFRNPHMETCRHTKKFQLRAQNLELAVNRSMHPRLNLLITLNKTNLT